MQSIAEFQIRYRQYLNESAVLDPSAPAASIDPPLLLKAYRAMVLVRAFDNKVIALQRTGQMGTFAACLGQEAVGAGIGLAMTAADVFVPYYRDQVTQLLRGMTMSKLMQYWGGDERGSDIACCRQDLPICVPIATQITHAAGVATAMKLRHQKRAVVVTCGDGATSRGDFYEGINVAGVWQLPLVLVVNNNQWAISVRRQYQSGSKSLAQKGIAAGIACEQVDGNDFIAVHGAMTEALQRAYNGKGATLIEAVSYRLGDHTTADDASRYRPAEELSQAWEKEPVKRLQTYLHNNNLWDSGQEQALQQQVQQDIQQAVEDYARQQPQPPESMFEHVYATWPHNYQWQVDELRDRGTTVHTGGNHEHRSQTSD